MTNIAEHLFLLFIFIKSLAAVTGGRNSNTTPAQSPVVVCNSPFFARTKIIPLAN